MRYVRPSTKSLAERLFVGRALGAPVLLHRIALLALLAWITPFAARGGTLQVTAPAKHTDIYGLEATLSGSCASQDEVIVVAPPQINGAFSGCTSLEASGVQVSGTGVTFTAGRTIVLGEGFSVASGAPFTAILDPSIYRWASVRDNSPAGETAYRASFRLRLDDLVVADGDQLLHFAGYSNTGLLQLGLSVKYNTTLGENRLVLAAREDDGGLVETPFGAEVALPAGWNQIELDWLAGGGFLRVFLDGVFFASLEGLDNDLGRIDSVQWGLVSGDGASTSGKVQLDDFYSSR